MKVGVLFSGGKDSCLALHKFIKSGGKVDCLLSVLPKSRDSWMFHKPELRLLKKQAEMLSLKLVIEKTKGEKEKELSDLKNLIKKSKVDMVVVGGIKSSYQASRIEKICTELGVKVYAPLLNYDVEKLWNELLGCGFKIVITKISCEGIPRESIGKIIGTQEFEKMKKLSEKVKFRLDFEGGEAETAVLWMPEFKNEIKLDYDIKSEGDYRHFIRIKGVR